MKIKTYQFFADPGHAWLRVKKSELIALGIANLISRYSYQKNDNVYLEEDRDASIFLHALKEKGIEYKITEHNRNGRSTIRNYNNYSKEN